MGKIILVLLFVCFGVVSPCEANPLDRATFLYRYWNASNAMWKHTQYIKGTHSYYITYKEYASTFSPSDFLRLASSKDDFFRGIRKSPWQSTEQDHRCEVFVKG